MRADRYCSLKNSDHNYRSYNTEILLKFRCLMSVSAQKATKLRQLPLNESLAKYL